MESEANRETVVERIAQARDEGATVLDLSGLELTSLPPEIGQLTALTELSVHSNQLTALPPEIGQLTALTELNVSANELTALPPEIGQLTALTKLDVSYNQLTALPPEIGQLTALTELSVHSNQLTALPPEIGWLTALTELYIDENQLTALAPEIGQLTALTELSIYNNQLTALPPEIFCLNALNYLNVHSNQITSLPSDIGQLTALTELNVSGNLLTMLPPEIGRLIKLKELYAHINQLTALPPEIGQLIALTELYLENNQLTELPPEIGQLMALKFLDLSNNRLTALPSEISQLTTLTELYAYGNQLPASITAALREGLTTLRTLLANLDDPSKVKIVSEVKLMITGEGNVGKTSLRKALDEKAKVLRKEPTTWGVECGQFLLPHPERSDREITFNYWDFGGQSIYRVTHQFFFSTDGIYLLLWHPREGEERGRVNDWLDRIHARTAGKAKVILVATHAKEEDGGTYRSEIDLARLDPSHRALIVDQISVDSIEDYNIDALRKILVRAAKDLPGVDNPINIFWDEARREILDPGNDAPWMHFTQLEKICRRHGIEDEDAIEAMAATYIHRLGRGVWYGLDWPDDPLLRDTIVLDPTWLSQAFMQLVQHEPTRAAGGMLEHDHLKDAWQGHKNDNWIEYEVGEFARLMPILREQRVALPTRGSLGRRSLVPQLVPYPKPVVPWVSPDELSVEKKVIRIRTKLTPDVDGIMPQLIALMEPYHHYPADADCGAFWAEGLFLRDEEGRYRNDALIEFSRERSHALLEISVTGEQPGFLWHQIDRAIASLEEFWPGLIREDEVFCPTRRGDFCRGRFELEDVITAQREEDPIKCPKCRVTHEGDTLVMGLSRVRGGLTEDRAAHDNLQYLRHRDERRAPRSVLIVPVDPKMRWRDIKNWELLGRKRLKAILLSEFSGAEIAEKTFTAQKGLFKYLGPVAKIGAAFAGAPLPFGLPEGMESMLGDMADTMDRLGELPSGEEMEEAPQANLYLMRRFLDAIGLDPEAHGMGLEKAGGEWYWMSAAELTQHRPTRAALPNFS